MPAVRFSASPPPSPHRPASSRTAGSELPQSQPLRSALARHEVSIEATLGLVFQSCDKRLHGQDALPPRKDRLPHSESDLTQLQRQSTPTRPPRPASAALQGAQAYLDATIKPSTMRLKDVEAWVEDSLSAHQLHNLGSHRPLSSSDPVTCHPYEKHSSGGSSLMSPVSASPEDRPKLHGELLRRLKSPSISHANLKRFARSPSDLANWIKTPSQGSGPRSRSTSQATEAGNESEVSASGRRWSASSRRHLRNLSDSSQRALLSPGTPPTYRTKIAGFHRRFYSTDTASDSSDSSWTSFGCIDGMRRRSLGTGGEKTEKTEKDGENHVQQAPEEEDEKEEEKKKEEEEERIGSMKKAFKRCASRLALPRRSAGGCRESDTSNMCPF